MTVAPARDARTRKEHVLHLLETERDAWVATADAEARVCQVPLSFSWDGERLTFATPEGSATGRNLARAGTVRIALGGTRDVVLIEGAVRTYGPEEVPDEVAEAFVGDGSWDPRKDSAGKAGRYAFYVVTPTVVQAWREANELKGRTLMRGGDWLA